MSLIEPGSLREIGHNRYRGRCPIQQHRSVSTFSVAPHEDGHLVFQCFACGARGSVIDLLAAIDGISVTDAIRKLSSKDLPQLSKDAILQRVQDAIERSYPAFGILVCDDCGKTLRVESELDFAILRSGSSWIWKVSRNGNKATCCN